MRSLRASPDLAATVATALVALVVGLAPAPTWLRVAALLPMLFLAPGYAAAAALFRPGALPSAERTVYVVVLSVSISTLSGVLVQLVVPLGRVTWTVLLFAVVCALSAAALARREELPPDWPRPRVVLPRIDTASLGAVVAAVAIAIWAISISSEGAREEREAIHFAELWALPQPPAPEQGPQSTVEIGVGSEEGERTAFLVRAEHAGAVVGEWEVELDDGGRWETSIPAPPISPTEPLRVTLLKDGVGYRRVFLRTELAS